MRASRSLEILADPTRVLCASRIYVEKRMFASEQLQQFLEFYFILTTAGKNRNNQIFNDQDLRDPQIHSNPIGQAIDQDHNDGFEAIVGEIVESAYFPARGSNPSGIRCKGVVFEKQYPKVGFKVRQGAGKWATMSMEAYGDPVEPIGDSKIIHRPSFIGAGIVRFPGNILSQIDQIVDPIDKSVPSAAAMRAAGLALMTANCRMR